MQMFRRILQDLGFVDEMAGVVWGSIKRHSEGKIQCDHV